jgi:aspartate-semialdehyde dehydrogenase
VAIWPIYKAVGLKRAIISSYQAVSGAGRGGIRQLENECKQENIIVKTFAHRISKNVIPQIGGFKEFAYTTEEWKIVLESQKIMHDKRINISATCVRVPVITGHCEAIYLETKRRITVRKARGILSRSPGIKVIDHPAEGKYPLPIDAEKRDEVFIGRIREDPSLKNGLWLWVVADNLRKGAALNAIQIAEHLIS